MGLPINAIPKICARFSTTLAAKILSTDTSLTLESALDDAGNAITGVVGLTIDNEDMVGTKSGTSVTGLLRGVDPQDGVTERTALKADHQRGAVVKITTSPFLTNLYRLANGVEGFPNQLSYKTSGYPTPVNDYDIPTKKYVDDQVNGTPVSMNRTVVSGTAGEIFVAGNLVYLKAADARWWKCDADTAATVDNINLGIAQGAGTAGASVTSGVLVYGRDTNNSGLTAGSTYYASNTAGGISSSAGTTEVAIGQADVDGYLFFSPRYNQQLTEDQQDALAGTSGTPSNSNKYVTANDEGRNLGLYNYGASVVGTDAYAITLSPAITALVAGDEFNVLADVGNTGACTLNVNALGATNIKTQDGSNPADGYIHANSLFKVRYDGTNMVLQSPNAVDTKPTKIVTATVMDAFVSTSAGLVYAGGSSTNNVHLDFADSVVDNALFNIVVPPNVTSLTAISVLYERSNTGNLYLQFSAGLAPIAGGAYTADTTDTLTTYAVTASAGTLGLITVPSSAFSGIGTVAPGDVVTLFVNRDANNVADTFGATWMVFGVQFTFA